MMADSSLGKRIQYWVKYWMGSLHTLQRPMKRPILLFSSRRSGSTLLTEIIGCENHTNTIDQPLDLWHYNPYADLLPHPPLSKFVGLSEEELAKLYFYLHRLFTGKIRVYSRWNILSPDYNFRVNRLIFKILSAKFLMDWVDANFEVDIVYLVRHPVPYALSVMRLDWGVTAQAFLEDPVFAERHLDKEKLTMCYQILENGTRLQKHILEWGLENLYPLTVFRERSWLTLTYEELIAKPVSVCRLLAEHLDLADPVKMSERVLTPSKTVSPKSKRVVSTQASSYLLSRWLNQVDLDEVSVAMSVVYKILNIDCYRADSPAPDSDLCHFGPLEL